MRRSDCLPPKKFHCLSCPGAALSWSAPPWKLPIHRSLRVCAWACEGQSRPGRAICTVAAQPASSNPPPSPYFPRLQRTTAAVETCHARCCPVAQRSRGCRKRCRRYARAPVYLSEGTTCAHIRVSISRIATTPGGSSERSCRFECRLRQNVEDARRGKGGDKGERSPEEGLAMTGFLRRGELRSDEEGSRGD